MSLLIADRAVDLAGAPLAGRSVTVAYSGLDPFALQSGTWRVAEQGRVTTTTQPDGTFDVQLLWPSEMQPATGISAIITLPDGVQYAGVVPDGVTGPLTIYQLVTGYSGAPYSWGKVTGAAAAQVQVIGGGMTNPMTAAADLIVGGAAGAATRLAKGADSQVLTVDPITHLLVWATPSAGGMTNPMTAAADLLIGGAAGAPARLAKGADGQVLTVDPTTHLLVWATPASPGLTDPLTTRGDIITRGASSTGRLALGTTGSVLTSDGTDAAWHTPVPAAWSWSTKTAAYTITTADTGILGDATGGAFSVTLPTAVGATQQYVVKKKDSSANAITVATSSSQTIDGAATYVLATRYESVTLASDGANWFIA